MLTARLFFAILYLQGGDILKDRIRKIRKESNLTQEKFAEKLGLKRNTIATYETGKSEPMDSIIVSICREFSINEEWLRTGKGEMYQLVEDRLSAHVADIVSGDDDFIKDFSEVYMELDPDCKKALKTLAANMAKKAKEREQP